jgi:hypothetical protein
VLVLRPVLGAVLRGPVPPVTGGATSRRKGAAWQTAVRAALAPHATGEVRARSAGEDGDDLACTLAGVPLSIECKNARAHDFAGWLDQAMNNAPEYAVPVVIAHRRGKAHPLDAYAVLTLADLLTALALAYDAGKATR